MNKEQWKAIAEKLAEYLDSACRKYPTVEECVNCPLPCTGGMTWIAKAKKELGYE